MTDCIRSTNVVLLGGSQCDGRIWAHQRAALEARVNVYAASVLGGNHVQVIAQQLLLALPERFALVGFSFGGMLAFEMLRQAPERIERLVLMDTNYWADLPAANRQRQIAIVRQGGLQDLVRSQLLPKYFAAANAERKDLCELVETMALDLGELAFIQQAQALSMRPDSSSLLAKIKCPTLVLCGAEDQLCPVSAHQTMAAVIPGAELQVIPGAGHFPMLEQPELVTEALLAWLG